MLWCIHMKPTGYKVRSTSFTESNHLLIWNSISSAFLSVSFSPVDFLMWKLYFSKPPSMTQNYHLCQLKFKHLLLRPNKQYYLNCDINILLPRTPRSWLNHTLDWLVTVILWCRNVKLMYYKGRNASLTSINNLSRQNRPFNAYLLPLFGIWCLKYELVWL